MKKPQLYRGQWPRNVSSLAKYSVRNVDGMWKASVFYDLGDGARFLAVEDDTDIVERVNQIKREMAGPEGGTFYINEYQHLIVPVERDGSSHYYCAGKVDKNFVFDFEGQQLTPKPVTLEGNDLRIGDPWVGPRPGIPYVLSAGGNDIYYETPALTDTDPPSVRLRVTQKVQLSKAINDSHSVSRTTQPIKDIRGPQGGRFYVNEVKAIFTPIDKGDGNGLNYVYCGQIDSSCWFPEPELS